MDQTEKQKKEKENYELYKPKDEDKAEIDFVYSEIDDMIEVRNQKFRQFNDRTLLEFIDDSEKRVQGYVPSREEQGKEEWQSNVFNQATRNKTKALVAAVASTPPKTPIRARSMLDGSYDFRRSEYMEMLVEHARSGINPEVSIFWEAWQGAVQGTVIKYIGYFKSVQKRKYIKSYNLETGEMEFGERDVVVSDECVDAFVNLNELFIKNIYIHDIQEQPAIAWVRYLDRATTEMELGKYKNWKFVHGKNHQRYKAETRTWALEKFQDRVDEDEYEVIKYYNKAKDKYCIIVNGVLLLSVPLLWGLRKKYYPFAKQIFEPFSGREFFYGNSLPNANMDVQDTINSLYNMALDKNYRSLVPEKLVGTKNKDLLELENEESGIDNVIYVDDVNQVKYLESPGVNNAEFGLIKFVGQQMDLGTVDSNQQGIANRGVTAREIVIANENAKKIKGIFFTFLSDLWIQKTKLTVTNILMHYPIAKMEKIIGKDGVETVKEAYPVYYVNNADFPNGQKGVRALQFVGSKDDLPSRDDLDIEEEMMKLKGVNYLKTAVTTDYFYDFEYEPEVISDTMHQQNFAEAQAVFTEKLKIMMTAFPEAYQMNKRVLFEDFLKAYKDNIERYDLSVPPPTPAPGGTELDSGKAPADSAAVVAQ